jgi:hypothetical protein
MQGLLPVASPQNPSLGVLMSPPPPAALTFSVWLCGLSRALDYRPTESEFANPIIFLSRKSPCRICTAGTDSIQ